jgi:site-specific DNA-methyltransferase (adenine-specific)
MANAWDHGVPDVNVWREVIRVFKPGAMFMAFGGTRTHHRLMCAIEDAGFEIRDCLMWLYGSGFPKSLDIGKAIDKAAYTTPATDAAKLWDGYGTALKPAWEPIILAMKPCAGTFAENALEHGVAGLNIDAGRINPGEMIPGVPNGNRPLTSPHAEGRWPANLLLDEDAAAMLDRQSGTLHLRGNQKETNSGGGMYGHGVFKGVGFTESGYCGASRFFYVAKASTRERGEGNNHPTVKPLELMRYLCGLLCPPIGGILLDPFMGSGSTIIAGRRFFGRTVGIEIEERYCEMAAKRLQQEVMDFGKLASNAPMVSSSPQTALPSPLS